MDPREIDALVKEDLSLARNWSDVAKWAGNPLEAALWTIASEIAATRAALRAVGVEVKEK